VAEWIRGSSMSWTDTVTIVVIELTFGGCLLLLLLLLLASQYRNTEVRSKYMKDERHVYCRSISTN